MSLLGSYRECPRVQQACDLSINVGILEIKEAPLRAVKRQIAYRCIPPGD